LQGDSSNAGWMSGVGTTLMRFVTEVERRNLSTVQYMLKGGDVHANISYLGIYPLHLAVEQGDADMAAVLLKFGADVTKGPNGANAKNAEDLARSMRDDPKSKYRQEAAAIVEMIDEEEMIAATGTEKGTVVVTIAINAMNRRKMNWAGI